MLNLKTDKMRAEKDDGIGWMIFDNPARRNATSLEMWQAIAVILRDFAADPAVRVVVMRGAGDKAFVSGADISQFEDQRASAEAAERYTRISDDARAAMTGLDKPLIAMIRGFALGGGLDIAMTADLRIAAADAQFGIPAARLGIPYGFASLKKLVNLVGPAYAKEILMTARRLDAEEALRIGLVNRVVPVGDLEANVRATCATIIDNSPLSITANKVTIDQILKDPAERDMERIDALTRECFDSADYAEGRKAFMEKRKPVWTGR
jgi:enoyl-CoA hydratase/carnithine racemase